MHRFIKKENFKLGQIVILDEEEKHHMIRVMRKSKGQEVELINTKGQIALCSIQKQDTLRVLKVETKQRVKNITHLAIGLCQPSKIELITEKACELGIDHLHIFNGDKSTIKKLSSSKLNRLNSIRDSALKQSHRIWDMTISFYQSLKCIDFHAKELYFADLETKTCFKFVDKECMIIVGPESGLSNKEISFCREKRFYGFSLGQHILRAETAAIVSAFLLKG